VVALDVNGQEDPDPANAEPLAARTVCTGTVDFRNSVGDIADPGDPALHVMQCHLGEGSKVTLRVVPFSRVPAQ
jgi:hypothetical protein